MATSSKKFNLLGKKDSLSEWVSSNLKSYDTDLDEGVIVVSIIGKSSSGSSACKGDIIDEAIERNVFKRRFGDGLAIEEPFGCEIEGYFDSGNRVVFLHMVSAMDTDVFTSVTSNHSTDVNYSHRDINQTNSGTNDRGFIKLYNDCQAETAKCLLLLFSVSHIVLVSTPSIHFDTSLLNLLKIVESARDKFRPHITEALKGIEGLSRDWIETGRPCSPRVLFTFEPSLASVWSPPSRSLPRHEEVNNLFMNNLIKNRRKYELKLEDQIYRFMRRCRIITNICSNSLFAICNQMDFVYVYTKCSSIKDCQSYLDQLLYNYCSLDDKRQLNQNIGGDRRSFDTTGHRREDTTDDNDHTFHNFLFNHINIAHSKGFDDNVGRHNVVAVFEKPTVRQLFELLPKLTSLIFNDNEDDKNSSKNVDSDLLMNHLKTLFESESNKFIDLKCSTRSKLLVY